MVDDPGASSTTTLTLTIRRKWFDLIATGEKTEEYRRVSKWIHSRLFEKDNVTPRQYSYVRLRNGYSEKSPTIVCKWLGFRELKNGVAKTYRNGLVVEYSDVVYAISLGPIVAHAAATAS